MPDIGSVNQYAFSSNTSTNTKKKMAFWQQFWHVRREGLYLGLFEYDRLMGTLEFLLDQEYEEISF